MKRWPKLVLWVVTAVFLIGSLAVVAGSYWWSTVMVQVPDEAFLTNFDMPPAPPLADMLREYEVTTAEQISFTSRDGLQIEAIYLPSQNGAVVIAQHGLWASKRGVIPVAAMLAEHGYGVLLPDLRGHSATHGASLTFGQQEMNDLDAAYQYLLTQEEVDAERIAVYGESLGAAMVLLYSAQNPQIKAVVAQSPYASFQEQVKTGIEFVGLPKFPFAPLTLFFMERQLGFRLEDADFAPVAKIHEITPRPVFIMMGGKDTTVNPAGGQQLFDAAGDPRELWFDPDLGHVEFFGWRREEFETRVVGFYDRYLLNQP